MPKRPKTPRPDPEPKLISNDLPLVRQKALEAVNDFNNRCYWIRNLDTAQSRAAYERVFGEPAPNLGIRSYMRKRFHELFGMSAPLTTPEYDLKTIVGYELQYRGIMESGMPEEFYKRFYKDFFINYAASRKLLTNRKEALEEFIGSMGTMMAATDYYVKLKKERFEQMAKKASSKKKKQDKERVPRGKSARIVAKNFIMMNKYTNDQIVEMVSKECPGTKFSKHLVNWYRKFINAGDRSNAGLDKPKTPLAEIAGIVKSKATPKKKSGKVKKSKKSKKRKKAS